MLYIVLDINLEKIIFFNNKKKAAPKLGQKLEVQLYFLGKKLKCILKVSKIENSCLG